MPSNPSLQVVHEGATCPACAGPLQDAVTAACGHTFCSLCLSACAQMGAQPSGRVLLCPLCQEEEEQTETFMDPVPLGPVGETYCQEHGEKIYFFCKNDSEFLCVFCREGPSHQAHTVGVLEEAIQPYRDRLKSRLESLSTERDKIEDIKCREDQKLHMLLTQIENKKQQVETTFKRLQQELEDQRHLLLARLRELEQQVWKERDEYVTKVSEEVTRLAVQVKELEEKCQQPAMDVTLDPQTASASLVLSEDRKSVRYTRKKRNLPDSPLRFDGLPVVLGCPGFCSGLHHWQVEVQLGDGGGCTVGVAAEEVRRKGEMGLSAQEGVWAVIISHQQCWASTSPGTDLPLSDIPHCVDVTLDYEAGRVTLLDADTQVPIFTFTASFSGRVFPFFAVWKKGSCLTLKG
ncbi:Tripartite motif-containing protein 15 [Sciurus carolinensis]|uniref:E3 ubiquitin-protein ligase TRIM15 n=1 Tax=Sciurus carolinensis TaxID=30640 RepID=A0AA41MQX3_SCICA|nr:Tripartite motif-containing protein 15 [Sciurus carolinensis]